MNSCRELHRTGSCYFSVKQLKDILDACCSWRAGRVIYKDLLFGFFVCLWSLVLVWWVFFMVEEKYPHIKIFNIPIRWEIGRKKPEIFIYEAGTSLWLTPVLVTIWDAAAQLLKDLQPLPSVKLQFLCTSLWNQSCKHMQVLANHVPERNIVCQIKIFQHVFWTGTCFQHTFCVNTGKKWGIRSVLQKWQQQWSLEATLDWIVIWKN